MARAPNRCSDARARVDGPSAARADGHVLGPRRCSAGIDDRGSCLALEASLEPTPDGRATQPPVDG
eukprot:90788-Alexandrium_andersonii.AAC.1